MEVLVVPGLYKPIDEQAQQLVYNQVANLWRYDGYEVAVHRFGWYDHASIDEQQGRLAEMISAARSNSVYAVGASAGGLAVINALTDVPDKLRGVAVIASPLKMSEDQLSEFGRLSFVPSMFEEAYHKCDAVLENLGMDIANRAVSFYAKRDNLVQPQWSRRNPVPGRELRAWGHKMTIFAALTVYRKLVQNALAELDRDG